MDLNIFCTQINLSFNLVFLQTSGGTLMYTTHTCTSTNYTHSTPYLVFSESTWIKVVAGDITNGNLMILNLFHSVVYWKLQHGLAFLRPHVNKRAGGKQIGCHQEYFYFYSSMFGLKYCVELVYRLLQLVESYSTCSVK